MEWRRRCEATADRSTIESEADAMAVSNRGTLAGLTQFPRAAAVTDRKRWIQVRCRRVKNSPTAWDNLIPDRSQVVDSQRRDVRVVEGARLERSTPIDLSC